MALLISVEHEALVRNGHCARQLGDGYRLGLKRLGRSGEVVQHHIQYQAIGGRVVIVQRVGQLQPDVVQAFLDATCTRQFKHRRAVIQCQYLLKASRQLRQKTTVAGADLHGAGVTGKAQGVEQGQHAVTVLRQAGDQVLVRLEACGAAGEKGLAGGGAVLGGGGRLSMLILFTGMSRTSFSPSTKKWW